MNYDLIYDQLIFRAKARAWTRKNPADIYKEEHHILPKCLFPEFEDLRKFPWNSVFLTPREHFIVHQLLVKMDRYKNHKFYYKLIFGANSMCMDNNGHRVNNKQYGWLKIQLAEAKRINQTGKKADPVSVAKRKATIREKNKTKNLLSLMKKCKKKICKHRYAKPTQVTKDKLSAICGRPSSKKGKTYEEIYGIDKAIETKNKVRVAQTGKSPGNKGKKYPGSNGQSKHKGKTREEIYGVEKDADVNKKQSDRQKGSKRSAPTKLKMKISAIRRELKRYFRKTATEIFLSPQ